MYCRLKILTYRYGSFIVRCRCTKQFFLSRQQIMADIFHDIAALGSFLAFKKSIPKHEYRVFSPRRGCNID